MSKKIQKEIISPILPPSKLGILGGGQLGMMFTIEAKKMGYHVTVLDPDENAPAAQFADEHICLSFDSEEAFEILSKCAAVTTEFENVSADMMIRLAEKTRVSPSGYSVAVAQDRLLEKKQINLAGLKTAPYIKIESLQDINKKCIELFPAILKTATLGYDGKGQVIVHDLAELEKAFLELGNRLCVLEKKLDLIREVSVVVCRLNSRFIYCYPVVENVHKNGILFSSTVPTNLSQKTEYQIQKKAIELANHLDYEGVLAIEFFIVGENQEIIVNEMAPRPHNSGHYTLDACTVNQFEQQVRILCGLHPAKINLISPCTMINILGDSWGGSEQEPHWIYVLKERRTFLHLYGKKIPRVGRKMGHFTVLGKNGKMTLKKAINIYEKL